MRELKYLLVVPAIACSVVTGCSKNDATSRPTVPYATAETEPAPMAGSPESQMSNNASGPTPSPAPGFAPARPVATTVEPEPIAPDSTASTGKGKIAALSDGQIIQVIETVNAGEVEQAKLAQKTSRNADVKKFAAHMISEHGKAKQKFAALAKKQRIEQEQTPVAMDLSDKGAQVRSELEIAEPATFDSKYIDAQVQQHRAVLDLLSERLIPSAANDDLKSKLEDARAMVENHLSQAIALQQTLTQEAHH